MSGALGDSSNSLWQTMNEWASPWATQAPPTPPAEDVDAQEPRRDDTLAGGLSKRIDISDNPWGVSQDFEDDGDISGSVWDRQAGRFTVQSPSAQTFGLSSPTAHPRSPPLVSPAAFWGSDTRVNEDTPPASAEGESHSHGHRKVWSLDITERHEEEKKVELIGKHKPLPPLPPIEDLAEPSFEPPPQSSPASPLEPPSEPLPQPSSESPLEPRPEPPPEPSREETEEQWQEDTEVVQPSLPSSPVPSEAALQTEPIAHIELDKSLLSAAFPIPAPSAADVEEETPDIINKTSARKTWYRLTRPDTLFQQQNDSDLRTRWRGSATQRKVCSVLEDQLPREWNISGSRKSLPASTPFAWGSTSTSIDTTALYSSDRSPTSPRRNSHTRKLSLTSPPHSPTAASATGDKWASAGPSSGPAPAFFSWATRTSTDTNGEGKDTGARRPDSGISLGLRPLLPPPPRTPSPSPSQTHLPSLSHPPSQSQSPAHWQPLSPSKLDSPASSRTPASNNGSALQALQPESPAQWTPLSPVKIDSPLFSTAPALPAVPNIPVAPAGPPAADTSAPLQSGVSGQTRPLSPAIHIQESVQAAAEDDEFGDFESAPASRAPTPQLPSLPAVPSLDPPAHLRLLSASASELGSKAVSRDTLQSLSGLQAVGVSGSSGAWGAVGPRDTESVVQEIVQGLPDWSYMLA